MTTDEPTPPVPDEWKDVIGILDDEVISIPDDPEPEPVEKIEIDDLGWPVGFHERMYGCIADEAFVPPPRGMPRPVPPT